MKLRILFTGATGVIGKRAIPLLRDAGHEVDAVYRSGQDLARLKRMGVNPVLVDLFDPEAIDEAVAGKDVVMHFATSIPSQAGIRKRSSWNTNDRLRTETTAMLVDAAIRHGVSRFVQESITFTYADGGSEWLDESAPIAPVWEVLESALDAERAVQRFDEGDGVGVVLRLARLYGPADTSGEYVEAIRARGVPMVGAGDNFVSSLHVDDAASAVLASLATHGGVFNVSDDEPLTAADNLEALVAAVGAPNPRRVPAGIAQLVAGKAVRMLTVSHRVSNTAFKEATGWEPSYPSAATGWARTFGQNLAA